MLAEGNEFKWQISRWKNERQTPVIITFVVVFMELIRMRDPHLHKN